MSYVRTRDALGRTRTAFSDGVTVLVRRPDPAPVRDGLADSDVDFQRPLHSLTANWDSFGDARSTLPSDHVIGFVGQDKPPHSALASSVPFLPPPFVMPCACFPPI